VRIGIAGPISTDSVASLLRGDGVGLPRGYYGAPLLGTLIRALLKRGHVVTAFTTSSDLPVVHGEPVTAEGDRFKIVYCPARPQAFRYRQGHWGRAVDLFRLEREALCKAMLDEAPEVIHAHWTYEFALAALDSGLPHVITCHDAPQVVLRYIPNAYRLVRYFMARNVLARARLLTVVSPYLKNMVEGYARVPVTVVPNPLPSGIVGVTRRVREYDPRRPRVAMVLNGWGRRKNPEVAFKAFALMRHRIPGAKLYVMGNDYGPGEKAESWAREHGLSGGVHFLGALPYTTLLDQLADSDLLLHPSLEETFGMSIAEAMALGVPVVGGEKSGAVPWVIGNAGVTTDVSSSSVLFEVMHGVLSNVSQRAELASRAQSAAWGRFGADTIADRYEILFSQAIDQE
jgi:L-malate glycosyltransferase